MRSIASEVSARLAGPASEMWNSQDLANILWAYAVLEVRLPLVTWTARLFMGILGVAA